MAEDREKLRELRSLLADARIDWDLMGAPPELPPMDDAMLKQMCRDTIEEIKRDFPETLAAIRAGTINAPAPRENPQHLHQLTETLFQLGVFYDGTTERPDLDAIGFDPTENRQIAEGIIDDMLARFPKMMAARLRGEETPLLSSFFEAQPYRDAPLVGDLPPLKGKN